MTMGAASFRLCVLCMVANVIANIASSTARADKVHLVSGAVLEGRVTEQGDKIVVAMESGTVSLAKTAVERLELRRAPQDELAERRAALRADDVAGRIVLANFCRAHDLASSARELLREIIALVPDHAEAHARLGEVKTKDGWVSLTARPGANDRSTDARAQRSLLALENEKARFERDRAELLLREKQLELKQKQAEAEERGKTPRDPLWATPGYAYGPYYSHYGAPFFGGSGSLPPSPMPFVAPPFNINGVRDPHDMSFSLPGVRDPKSYFGR